MPDLAANLLYMAAITGAGIAVFVFCFTVLAVISGAVTGWVSKRIPLHCELCEFRGTRAEVITHQAREHDYP